MWKVRVGFICVVVNSFIFDNSLFIDFHRILIIWAQCGSGTLNTCG